MSIGLLEGQCYKVWGRETVYIGQEVMSGEMQYKFRRIDGMGIICLTAETLDREVELIEIKR